MWNIKDKICLITGATSGVGQQTALALCRQGAKVVFTYRNEQKANETLALIESKIGVKPEMYFCDFSSLDSIRKFSEKFKSQHTKLDVLINNSGICEMERKISTDGIEMNFAVNHLAPFLLTNLLLDIIMNNGSARVINVASGAHKNAKINFDDLEIKKSFSGFKAYGQSKLANILFTKSLAKSLENTNVSVYCLHPGFVSTGIFKNMGKFSIGLLRVFMISPEKGAQTSVFLATSDSIDAPSGSYFYQKKVVNSSADSNDNIIADKLWIISSKYVDL
ncbi:MAG: SDR family oxidoreductase [Bacteroidota bacterium]